MKPVQWITYPYKDETEVLSFQKIIKTEKEIKKATIFASSMGTYALYLDGNRVGKGVLTPGFICYKNRVIYQEYDVTNLMKKETCVNMSVGQGWAVGNIGFFNNNHFFCDHTAVIACIQLVFADGTQEIIHTDDTWDVFTTGIQTDSIYDGEIVDRSKAPNHLGKAKLDTTISVCVEPQDGEWITEQDIIYPMSYIETPKGEKVIDFGQNMTGYVKVRIHAKKGDRIVLHHAEVLDKDGNFYTENMRHATNEVVYICSGEEEEFFPTYTFQGFRYIQIVEYPTENIDLNAFRAVVVHSEMQRTSTFTCGNEKINQLYHNIIWGQKSNYLDVPTDCPQRDERLGWTGDAQVFCRTGAINFNVSKFFHKWLRDMAIDQGEDGSVLGVVPDCIPNRNTLVSAAWGDAACIIPWEMYLAYGDKKELKIHYPMMCKWVQYMYNFGPKKYLWLGGLHYGDWLALDAGPDFCVGATSCDLIASAFYAYSVSLVIKAGKAIGKNVEKYEKLYENVRNAFRKYFMKDGLPKKRFESSRSLEEGQNKDGGKCGITQTAIVLILHFHLYEENEKEVLVNKLLQLIKENDGLMATGFVGTPYILHVLTECGYENEAYRLLMEERSPSWLYSVNHGATTMWEHWNGIKEDGTFWSKSMNSYNHYAYGAVFDWIFGKAVGINPCEENPGYKEVVLQPHPNKVLSFVDSSIETKFGKLQMHWYYKEDKVYYEISIPEGVNAKLKLPKGLQKELSSGQYCFVE